MHWVIMEKTPNCFWISSDLGRYGFQGNVLGRHILFEFFLKVFHVQPLVI